MHQKPGNHTKAWTPEEIGELKRLAEANTSPRGIARALGRTEEAVRSRVRDEKITLPRAHKRPG